MGWRGKFSFCEAFYLITLSMGALEWHAKL
jgi:hypothetical protein